MEPTCKNCGSPIMPHDIMIEGEGGSFCSTQCMSDYTTLDMGKEYGEPSQSSDDNQCPGST